MPLVGLESNLYIAALLPKQARARWAGGAQPSAGSFRPELQPGTKHWAPAAAPGEAEGVPVRSSKP